MVSITNLQARTRYHLQIFRLTYTRDPFSDSKPIPDEKSPQFKKKPSAFVILYNIYQLQNKRVTKMSTLIYLVHQNNLLQDLKRPHITQTPT